MSSTFEQDQISITQITSIEEQTDFIITRILEVNHIKTDYKLPFFIGKIGKTYNGAPKVSSIYYYSDRHKKLKNPYERKELAILVNRGRILPQEGTWVFSHL